MQYMTPIKQDTERNYTQANKTAIMLDRSGA